MSTLPFSQACENNKQPILDKLTDMLDTPQTVLEIGSGTGQHAVWFASHMPHLSWHPSDLPENLPGLNERLAVEGRANITPPFDLDVAHHNWGIEPVDAVFTANSLHIMSKTHVEAFFEGVGRTLKPTGHLLIYGPLKYAGEFTTQSNANFDLWLKGRDSLSGVRDIEWLVDLAKNIDCELVFDYPMPANNQLLHLRRS